MMNNNIFLIIWNVCFCLNYFFFGVINNLFLDGIIIFFFFVMLFVYVIDVVLGKVWVEENYRIYKDYIIYIKNYLIICYIVIKKYYCKYDFRIVRINMNCLFN